MVDLQVADVVALLLHIGTQSLRSNTGLLVLRTSRKRNLAGYIWGARLEELQDGVPA